MVIQLILIMLGITLQSIFIGIEHKKNYVLAVVFKGLASLTFVSLGIICLKTSTTYSILIIAGLILGLVGDVLLNLRFVLKKIGDKVFLAGIASFFTGHVVYLIAIIPYANNIILSILIGVIFSAVLLIYIFKTMEVKIAFKVFGIFYLGIIFIMTSIAINSALLIANKQLILFATGAIAFLISDVVLIFNTFGGNEKFSLRITNLSFYYVGQLLIALSLLFI